MTDLPSSPVSHRPPRPAGARGRSALLAGLAAVVSAATIAFAAAGPARDDMKVVDKAEDGLAPVRAMLAQYDRQQDERALAEALRWFERAWAADDLRAMALVEPLHLRACQHPRLQWNWLCETGE